MVEQKKYKSWALWVAIAALVVWVVNTFWGMDIAPQMSSFLNVLCPVVVGFGIVNDPNSKTTF